MLSVASVVSTVSVSVVAFSVPYVTVIYADPSASAVNRPVASTPRTAGSELAKVHSNKSAGYEVAAGIVCTLTMPLSPTLSVVEATEAVIPVGS